MPDILSNDEINHELKIIISIAAGQGVSVEAVATLVNALELRRQNDLLEERNALLEKIERSQRKISNRS